MKVLLAKEAGFCFGVKRAAEMITQSINDGEKINTYGPLIHNPEFTKFLEKKGVFIVNSLGDIKAKKVVIRSHGITKEEERKIRNKKVKIINATCPFVKKVQKQAEIFEKQGYKILILGEKSHPEVIGINGYAPSSIVIKDISDIPEFEAKEKIGLISQTTQNLKLFNKIVEFLKKKYKNLEIINTICDATKKRQKAAGQLARKVDIMVVIGGRNSSNTTRLKEICEKITKTYHIEKDSELKKEWFLKVKSVGITAGASTPDFSIFQVLETIKSYG